MEKEFSTLSPFYNISESSKPFAISGMLTMLSPANGILANTIMFKEPKPNEDTIFANLRRVEVSA